MKPDKATQWTLMKALSSIDTQQLNRGIQRLYALNNFATFGVDALTIVNQLVPSDAPLFQQTDTRTCAVAVAFLPDSGWGTPERLALIREVLPQHLHEHPVLQNMPLTLHGVYKVSDFLSQPELHQREGIYQQFLRPLAIEDQLQFFLPVAQPGDWQQLAQAHTVQSGFILSHGERSFTERDRLILNLLRPHIFQAYQNVERYDQAHRSLGQLQRSVNHLGLVSLNREGQVQWATSQATTWLETYFAPPTCTGYLPDELQLWVQEHGHGAMHGSLNVERACAQLVIRLTIEPGADRYTLTIEEQSRSNLQSLALLGLSQRETEVLGWLMQGRDNKTIAVQMAVGTSTIRKHLESIYRKLNVQSRTAAVAQALAQLGLMEHDGR
jgi:DNA-binding CsgD family transcriptional regulator